MGGVTSRLSSAPDPSGDACPPEVARVLTSLLCSTAPPLPSTPTGTTEDPWVSSMLSSIPHRRNLPRRLPSQVAQSAASENLRRLSLHAIHLLKHSHAQSATSAECEKAVALIRLAAVSPAGPLCAKMDPPATVSVAPAPCAAAASSMNLTMLPAVFPRLVRALAEFLIAQAEGGPGALGEEATMGLEQQCATALVALVARPGAGDGDDMAMELATSALTGESVSTTTTIRRRSLVAPLVQGLVRRTLSLAAVNAVVAPHAVTEGALAASATGGPPVVTSASVETVAPPYAAGAGILRIWASLTNIIALPLAALQFLTAVVTAHSAEMALRLRSGQSSLLPITAPGTALVTRRGDDSVQERQKLLREALVDLLLVLAHPAVPTSPDYSASPFRLALNGLQDSGGGNQGAVDFSRLYDYISRNLTDSSVLLLYFFLQGNPAFLQYALARTDTDTLLVPLLQLLYESVEAIDQFGRQQTIYIAVIVLLMLTRDPEFSRNIHHVRVERVWWYKDRYLSESTLGGLLVLVLVRVVQVNLKRLRDPYLHTNCLAVLANAAVHFSGLAVYPSLRLVKMVELIAVRCAPLGESSSSGAADGEAEPAESTTSYQGFLKAMMRIVVNALACGMDRNPHLVYALLQQKAIFAKLSEGRWPELVGYANAVLSVTGFFEKEVACALPTEEERTLEKITEVIVVKSPSCKSQLKLAPEQIEYNYEEEPTACEFFRPLVWSLVTAMDEFALPPSPSPILPPTETVVAPKPEDIV